MRLGSKVDLAKVSHSNYSEFMGSASLEGLKHMEYKQNPFLKKQHFYIYLFQQVNWLFKLLIEKPCKCLPSNWVKTFYFVEKKEAVAVPDIVIFANFCRQIRQQFDR